MSFLPALMQNLFQGIEQFFSWVNGNAPEMLSAFVTKKYLPDW